MWWTLVDLQFDWNGQEVACTFYFPFIQSVAGRSRLGRRVYIYFTIPFRDIYRPGALEGIVEELKIQARDRARAEEFDLPCDIRPATLRRLYTEAGYDNAIAMQRRQYVGEGA